MEKIHTNLNKEKKKKMLNIAAIILGVILILTISFYIGNDKFRTMFDRYILRKEVTQNNVVSIEINTDDNPTIYAYSKYIISLNKNKLTTYSNTGKKEYEHEIAVNDALFASNNRFLAVAQKNGQNIYLISESNILWQKETEGNIQKINVNKNGYVSVIISGSSYKTVIATYSPAGKELFKTYLSTTNAIDTDISNDNKYLSIAEINTSGTLIQSNIKIISIEKAQNDPTNSVIYTHNAEANDLIVDIKYQDRNKLICMYDTGIHILQDQKDEQILKFEDNKIMLSSIELNGYSAYTLEKTSGLFSNTQVILKNMHTTKENVYTIKSIIKEIYTHSDNIALNIGSEVHFINTNGWLIKKYVSEQEIKNIVISDKIAGIIYKNKIDIINI